MGGRRGATLCLVDAGQGGGPCTPACPPAGVGMMQMSFPLGGGGTFFTSWPLLDRRREGYSSVLSTAPLVAHNPRCSRVDGERCRGSKKAPRGPGPYFDNPS